MIKNDRLTKFSLEMCSDNCDECSVPTTCQTCNTDYGLDDLTLQCRQCNPIGEYYEFNKCGSNWLENLSNLIIVL